MKARINFLLSSLNKRLNFIDLEIDKQIQQCEKAIELTIKSKVHLRILVLKLKHNLKWTVKEVDVPFVQNRHKWLRTA